MRLADESYKKKPEPRRLSADHGRGSSMLVMAAAAPSGANTRLHLIFLRHLEGHGEAFPPRGFVFGFFFHLRKERNVVKRVWLCIFITIQALDLFIYYKKNQAHKILFILCLSQHGTDAILPSSIFLPPA